MSSMAYNLGSFIRTCNWGIAHHRDSLLGRFEVCYEQAYDPNELRPEKEWLDELADWIKGGCQPYIVEEDPEYTKEPEESTIDSRETDTTFPIEIRFIQKRPGNHLDGEHVIIKNPKDLPMGDPFEVIRTNVHPEKLYQVKHSTLEKIYTLFQVIKITDNPAIEWSRVYEASRRAHRALGDIL